MRGARLARVLAAFTALAALLAGCGDDSPNDPPEPGPDRTVEFPGDAATLAEALALAGPGDTLRVAAGTHMIDTTLVFDMAHSGVTLLGRAGSAIDSMNTPRPVLQFTPAARVDGIRVPPGVLGITIRGLEIRGSIRDGVQLTAPGGHLVDCRIDGANRYAVYCNGTGANSIVERNLLIDARFFGVRVDGGAEPLVVENTIVGAGDCGIITTFARATCRRNIIAESANLGIACIDDDLYRPQLACNVFFGNANAAYGPGCGPGPEDPPNGDREADPLFCDETSYAIAADSPCAPANSGDCGRIGAVGVGCPAGSR